ncbi:RNA export mediator Gle1 [Penicillium brasilianum]|uniref:mRNA export factor GLE1 n=1 Tax=Penicillium brasilianum TaxID=104259 RepID=A0A1S9RFQ8_PENBI|nr:RNA export mediator Gle1 [Penicillium brasilianum]
MTIRKVLPGSESPSRQLMLELARDLENVSLFNADLKKVRAYERKAFYDNLDRIDREREAAHTAALDEAAAFHDKVREEAEATLREHIRAEEEERLRQEEAARKEKERIERIRREEAEKLRRQQEEAARAEAERKAKEEAAKKAAEDAERARKAALEEKERQEREQRERAEADKRKQAEDAKKAQLEAEQQAKAQEMRKVGAAGLTTEEARIQDRYVELHKTLKEMREWLRVSVKDNPPAKQAMGDMRRSIKKCVGQLRDGKGVNKAQTQQIRVELEKACQMTEPSVDVRQFIAFPPAELAQTEHKVPAMLIYGLNMLAKALISALITEASINPAHAEPIGIVAAQIFSMDTFMVKGMPMGDILLAKYRVVCPALWGSTGNDKTESGRRALGWWREEAGGPFVSEQAHMDRMTALGAGFSALTLRNFGKTQRRNPFPNTIFWNSLQKILSIPPADMQDTQVALLHAMLRASSERILGFFGHVGLALLRRAIVDLPAALPRQTMNVNQLKLLKETYERDRRLVL